MARNIIITLGLVSIPVKVDKAVDDAGGRTPNTICAEGHDPARCRQDLKCSVCGNNDRSTFQKGFPSEDGGYIVVDPEELKESTDVPDQVKNSMQLSAHPRTSVEDSTVATGKVYNLLPGKGVDPSQYATVVQAVRNAHDDGTSICTVWAYRSKPAMYVLQARGEHLVAHELAWPETVRSVTPVDGQPDEALVNQFAMLISTSTTPFDAEAYRDNRAQSIEDLLDGREAQASGDPLDADAPKAAAPGSTNIADQLAAALAASAPTFSEDNTLDELKDACRERDLKVSGTKADLLARLSGAQEAA